MTQNTLLHPTNELHYDIYKPADAATALTATETIARQNIAAILALHDAERTFDNTLLALTRCALEFESVVGRISHLESVLGESWRAADLLATKRAAQLSNDIGLDVGLYEALLILRESKQYTHASPARRKLVDDTIRDYERGGIALPNAKKERLRQLRHELSQLSTRFSQNVVKAQDKTGLHVLDTTALDGLSDDFIADCHAAAQQKELSGYWIQNNEPNYVKVMTDCTVRSTRLAMYKVVKSGRLASNKRLLEGILAKRYEVAKLLGFKTFADLATSDRMAKTGQTARRFIRDLMRRYQPGIHGEHAALRDFARTYEKNPKLELHISDVDSGYDFYYASRLRDKTFHLDQQQLREYFPFDTVLHGMFDVLATLYGVTFKRLHQPVWHKDVQVYGIYDEQGRQLAIVWCDWFARVGKRPGAWMNHLYTADRANGLVAEPHLGMVCANLEPPRGNRPSLLSFEEVRTIWHEFGHFMHLALGRTELIEQTMAGCEWDFIEAPSQIMENWPWHTEVLQRISKHYRTGKPLPMELVQNLQASRNFRVAGKAVRQLIFAEWDLALHMDFAAAPPADPLAVAAAIKERAYGIAPAPYDRSLLSFTHIFAGGYAAGYYSYKWAEAIESDLFTTFEKKGVLNPQAGRAYRDGVLARGAEVPAATIVQVFLGRPSTPDAMLRRDGLL